jgi:hypothetical protein
LKIDYIQGTDKGSMVFNKEIGMQLMVAHIRKIFSSGQPFDEPNFLDEQIKKVVQKGIQVKWVAYWNL